MRKQILFLVFLVSCSNLNAKTKSVYKLVVGSIKRALVIEQKKDSCGVVINPLKSGLKTGDIISWYDLPDNPFIPTSIDTFKLIDYKKYTEHEIVIKDTVIQKRWLQLKDTSLETLIVKPFADYDFIEILPEGSKRRRITDPDGYITIQSNLGKQSYNQVMTALQTGKLIETTDNTFQLKDLYLYYESGEMRGVLVIKYGEDNSKVFNELKALGTGGRLILLAANVDLAALTEKEVSLFTLLTITP